MGRFTSGWKNPAEALVLGLPPRMPQAMLAGAGRRTANNTLGTGIMTRLDERYEPVVVTDADDIGSNPSANRPLLEIHAARLQRRSVLRGFVTAAAAGALGGTFTSKVALAAEASPSSLGFASIPQTITENHAVAPGYTATVLIRWGDPVLPGAPAWDPRHQTAEAQAKQFGYNCDFLAYFPLPRGSDSSDHGLLHANHEYTNPELMFPGWVKRTDAEDAGSDKSADSVTKASAEAQTAEQTRIEMMAHNGSVIEVRKENGRWTVVPDSRYARRITLDTEMRLSGPAAGHARMKTSYDPAGTKVFGTINNCAGGKTPWGTVLMAEENFHGYFGGGDPKSGPEAANYKRYGVTADARYPWHRTVARFDLAKEPHEPNRYGWMVEYDPYDPNSTPVKRTALGRCKHEGATSVVNKDGRVVFYSGDDERFEYLYRFVTEGPVRPEQPRGQPRPAR
jgi:secreted PhoX family phosphatase